jgi:hypothetical protein
MNILLLGKGGQVGWELQRALAPLGTLTALDFNTPGPARTGGGHRAGGQARCDRQCGGSHGG